MAPPAAQGFGGRKEGIPNKPHLIVVPTSLVDQWESELRRFTRPDAVEIIRVGTLQKKWGEDMERIRLGWKIRKPVSQVILVAHSVSNGQSSSRQTSNPIDPYLGVAANAFLVQNANHSFDSRWVASIEVFAA